MRFYWVWIQCDHKTKVCTTHQLDIFYLVFFSNFRKFRKFNSFNIEVLIIAFRLKKWLYFSSFFDRSLLFVCFSACLFCCFFVCLSEFVFVSVFVFLCVCCQWLLYSTSPPSGNQIDGLPLVLHNLHIMWFPYYIIYTC